ncbi:MAG: hypothetical protein Q8Q09_06095 [Deltaproteobacteria bacterium]|nr:hypothetical protein [Deltaproteobacteria bacterium]
MTGFRTIGALVFATLGIAVAANAGCSGRALIGSSRPDWRPVGCPQTGDPPVYLATGPGDIYRMDPESFGIERIGAITCPMSGQVSNLGINRRGDVLVSLGDMRGGRSMITGTMSLATCEAGGIQQVTPVSKFSSFVFALRDEGDSGGDDLYTFGYDDMVTTSYLVRSPNLFDPGEVLGQFRFAGGQRSDGLCQSGRQMMPDPLSCSAPRAYAQLASWPAGDARHRSLVAVAFADTDFKLMLIPNPDTAEISEVRTITGIPLDSSFRGFSATVWGNSVYLFLRRGETIAPDAGTTMMLPPPTRTTVHRVAIATGQAEMVAGALDIVVAGAAVPPCIRYATTR